MNKNKLQDTYKKIYDWATRPSRDNFLHLVAGMIVASAVAIWFPVLAPYCLLFATGVGICKAFFDRWLWGVFSPNDIAWTFLGGLTIAVLVWLGELL